MLGVPLVLYLVVALLGAVVGISELVSRYPDAPREAVKTAPGIFYALLNAVAAGVALAVGAVVLAGDSDAATGPLVFTDGQLLELALVSGFGSLAFFRAKVVTLRVGDSDVGVGPSFVLDTILKAADRAVDRKRAEPRAKKVSDTMSSVSFSEAKVVLPTYCFAVMQNVSVEEQQRVALEIQALSEAEMPDRVKALNLGLLLMNIVGEEVLAIAVKNLQTEFAASSNMLETVEAAMARIGFERASINLVLLCAELAELSEEDREQLSFDVERLRTIEIGEHTQRFLLGLILIRAVGSEILEKAIEAIKPEIEVGAAGGGPAAAPRDAAASDPALGPEQEPEGEAEADPEGAGGDGTARPAR